MIHKSRAVAVVAAVALTGGLLVSGAGAASANSGYPVCVNVGTPVETGPGGGVIYHHERPAGLARLHQRGEPVPGPRAVCQPTRDPRLGLGRSLRQHPQPVRHAGRRRRLPTDPGRLSGDVADLPRSRYPARRYPQ